jgi:hypothetical protein
MLMSLPFFCFFICYLAQLVLASGTGNPQSPKHSVQLLALSGARRQRALRELCQVVVVVVVVVCVVCHIGGESSTLFTRSNEGSNRRARPRPIDEPKQHKRLDPPLRLLMGVVGDAPEDGVLALAAGLISRTPILNASMRANAVATCRLRSSCFSFSDCRIPSFVCRQ